MNCHTNGSKRQVFINSVTSTINTVFLKINFGYMHFVLKTGRGVALLLNSHPPHYQTTIIIIIITFSSFLSI